MKSFDAIILGGGAAGLMAALVAGQRGKRVLIVEHADAPGKKILISGGGRCNFTNIHTAPDRYLSANPHYMKSALARYSPRDFLDLVERHGIAWHEKTLGQLFCDGSAKQIVAMLWEECAAAGVELWLGDPASVERKRRLYDRLRCAHGEGTVPGPRHRRSVDPEDGRDQLRL